MVDALALALPETTKVVSEDGRPAYKAHDKMFVCHRGPRPDAIDPDTGERLDDVLIFRVENLEVKEIILADDRGIYFTTQHFNGYPAPTWSLSSPSSRARGLVQTGAIIRRRRRRVNEPRGSPPGIPQRAMPSGPTPANRSR